jgi:hypothetical protein
MHHDQPRKFSEFKIDILCIRDQLRLTPNSLTEGFTRNANKYISNNVFNKLQ